MELHLHSHQWERRWPHWPTAAAAGLAGGAVLMVLEFLWAMLIRDIRPWGASHAIAAIVMGPQALQSSGFDAAIVFVALVIHYVLGVVYALLLAAIIAPFHLDSSFGMALLAGAVFGCALYIVNFYGAAAFLPWFAQARGAEAIAAHLVFGMTAAGLYQALRANAAKA